MADTIELLAEKREITGKKVRILRNEGYTPATVYEKGKESINVRVSYLSLVKAYRQVGQSQPISLVVDGKKYLTMIKDAHIDPTRNTIMHVAFHAVNAKDPVEAEIPVTITGDVPAEKAGNFIVRPNDHVLVKALPANLPEELTVSAESLILPGDHLSVADLDAIEGVEILSDSDMTLAVVEEPRAAVEEPEEAAEAIDPSDVPSANGGETAKEATS
jgi:large subunit ribosomal protein L25